MTDRLTKKMKCLVPNMILKRMRANNSLARKVVNCAFGWNIAKINVKVHLNLKNKVEVDILNGSDSTLQNLFIYHLLLEEQDVVLDVGAQSGIHAIFLAKNIVTRGRVYAIENSQLLLRRLKQNIRLNKVRNIIPFSSINAALSAIPIDKIKLVHISACSQMDFETIKELVKMNRTIKVMWESSVIEDIESLTKFLFDPKINCQLVQKGRVFAIDFWDKFKEGAVLLASNERRTFRAIEDKLAEDGSDMAKTKISGFSLIRSASLYPFELCYESVLDFVDEFILAVDTNPPQSPFGRDWSNEILIDEFLTKTKHAEKIKIVEFDFKARYYQNYIPIGRWIADVNNRALERCSYNVCVYVMADEMYHENSYRSDIRRFVESEDDALSYYFLHFIGDLNHVIPPHNCTYTEAIRVFKKDMFYSCYDGYSFESLRSDNVKIRQAKVPIYHIGYVVNSKEKQSEHAGKGGLFKDVKPRYIEKFPSMPFCAPLPKYLYIDKYRSSRKMMEFL